MTERNQEKHAYKTHEKHIINQTKMCYHNNVSYIRNTATTAFAYKHPQQNAIRTENNWWLSSTFAVQPHLDLGHKEWYIERGFFLQPIKNISIIWIRLCQTNMPPYLVADVVPYRFTSFPRNSFRNFKIVKEGIKLRHALE